MSALRYSVVAMPKLDNDEEIRRIREAYDPWYHQMSPYIPMVPPFTPATLEEMENLNDYISLARRKMHPIAVSFHECIEVDDRLVLLLDGGRKELLELQKNLVCFGTTPLVTGAEYQPRLVVGRVPDPAKRGQALHEVGRLGRTLGVVDSVALIEFEPTGEPRLVANYPFGIGRVDYFDRFRA